LQDVIYENPGLFQVRIHVAQAGVDRPWRHRFDDFCNRAQNLLVHRQELAIGLLVGIVDR